MEAGATGSAAPVTPVAMETEADPLGTAVATAATVRGLFDVPRVGLTWAAFDLAAQKRFRDRVDAATAGARRSADSWRAQAATTRVREQQAARAAERARLEADRRTRAAAAAQRRAEQEARAEQRRLEARAAATARAAAASSASSSSPGSGSDETGSGSSSGFSDGYTGRRCYLPGGKVYRPC